MFWFLKYFTIIRYKNIKRNNNKNEANCIQPRYQILEKKKLFLGKIGEFKTNLKFFDDKLFKHSAHFKKKNSFIQKHTCKPKYQNIGVFVFIWVLSQ